MSPQLEFYRRNRDEINDKRLEFKKNSPEIHLLRCTKSRAKERGIDFNLELKDIQIPEVCPICKIPLYFSKKGRSNNTPSVDRIDPTKGYVKGNVAVISWRANRCKTNMSFLEMEALYKYALSSRT